MFLEKTIMASSEAVNITKDYNEKRRTGEIVSLKTGLIQLDENIGNFELNTITSIAARPSVGKSTYLMMVREGILRNNPNSKIMWLSFNLEMTTVNTINRMVCRQADITLKELTSKNKPISKDKLAYINDEYLDAISAMPIYYVNMPLNYDSLVSQLNAFWIEYCEKDENIIFIYDIDHIGIVNSPNNETEDKKIINLLKELNVFKKRIENKRRYTLGFILSQIGNDLESKERISNPQLQYPLLKDLYFGAGLQQYCDYILAINCPNKLHIKSYGNKHFPVMTVEQDVEDRFIVKSLIYCHILKQRDGSTSDNEIAMVAELQKYNMVEIESGTFYELCKDAMTMPQLNGKKVIKIDVTNENNDTDLDASI